MLMFLVFFFLEFVVSISKKRCQTIEVDINGIEPSGMTYSKRRGIFYVVSDEGEIIEYRLSSSPSPKKNRPNIFSGEYKSSTSYTQEFLNYTIPELGFTEGTDFTDWESATLSDDENFLFVGVEYPPTILKFNLTTEGQQDWIKFYDLPSFQGTSSNGLESLVRVPYFYEHGIPLKEYFYAGSQLNGKVYVYEFNATADEFRYVTEIQIGISDTQISLDMSSMYYDNKKVSFIADKYDKMVIYSINDITGLLHTKLDEIDVLEDDQEGHIIIPVAGEVDWFDYYVFICHDNDEHDIGLFYYKVGEGFISCKKKKSNRAFIIALSASIPTASAILVIIVCCVVSTFMVVIIILLYIRSSNIKKLKVVEHAVKDDNKLVSIVFTDIVSSTFLWESAQQLMASGFEKHNKLIKSKIKKYNGYCVKIMGDSFMVVFHEPSNALMFSIEVQRHLPQLNWDDRLCEYLACKEEKDGFGNILTRGLKVRIGIHCGYPKVKYFKKTNAYDYMGPVTNKASRIEHSTSGGRILVSSEFYKNVEEFIKRENKRSASDVLKINVKKIDNIQLRGIDQRVTLYCLSQQGRTTDESYFREMRNKKALVDAVTKDVIQKISYKLDVKNDLKMSASSPMLTTPITPKKYQMEKV